MPSAVVNNQPTMETVEVDPILPENRCPLAMKPGSSYCYCSCPPWMKQDKRRVNRLRKAVRQTFKTPQEIDAFLIHLLPFVDVICACPHGNHMIQEILKKASTTALQIFISSSPITQIIVNEFGSRVIENLTEMHNGLLVPLLFSRIWRTFHRLARNPHANYAIQKVCAMMPVEKLGTIMRVAVPHITRLAVDPHGAYVVQVILQRLHQAAATGYVYADDMPTGEEANVLRYSTLESVLTSLVNAGQKMIQHATGNFTVQAMVGVVAWCPAAEEKFLNGICERMVVYVACKYGTRVVEAIVEHGSPYGRDRIVNRLIELNDSEFSFFLQTPFSAYLYPKVLSCASHAQAVALEGKTNRALADTANPYAMGLLVEDVPADALEDIESVKPTFVSDAEFFYGAQTSATCG